MFVRRRSLPILIYCVATLLLASAGTVRGQQRPSAPGQAESLPGTLTAEQVKAALERFGRGGMPDLLNLFKDEIERDTKKPVDEKQLKQALDMFQANPELRKQFEEMGRKLKQGGAGKNAITPEERQQLEKLMELQRAMPNNGQPPFGMPMPPMPPKVGDPPMVGKGDPAPKNLDPPPMPNPGIPPGPGPGMAPDPKLIPKLDPEPKSPFDPKESPRDKAAHVAASLWERNIGPLDDTPAVKRALLDFVEGTEDLRDSDGKSFWDDLSAETGDSTSLSDFLDDAALGDSWKLPTFELPKLWNRDDTNVDVGSNSSSPRENWWSRNFGGRSTRSTPSAPRAPSSGGGLNLGIPSLQGGWLPVVILAAILFGGLLVWRFWGVKWSRNRAAGLGLFGPGWPIDPRRITTREHVVIAFEYLSVLICGPTAKTWTHNTIAAALSDLALTHGETAVMLARLYELARYAPLDEPLTTSELAEARRLVCALAGLEHE